MIFPLKSDGEGSLAFRSSPEESGCVLSLPWPSTLTILLVATLLAHMRSDSYAFLAEVAAMVAAQEENRSAASKLSSDAEHVGLASTPVVTI